MDAQKTSPWKLVGLILGATVLAAAGTAAVLVDKSKLFGSPEEKPSENAPPLTARLLESDSNTIVVDPEVVVALGIKTAAVNGPERYPLRHLFGLGPPPRLLILNGTLGYNTDRFVGINSIFSGQIKQIGTTNAPKPDANGNLSTDTRPLDLGDRVEAGQLLAVLSSKDLGQMKSQLISAVSQLRLDRERLQALETLFLRGSFPEQSVRDARQKLESDIVTLESARNTLRSWQIKTDVIESIEKEADSLLPRFKQVHLVEAVELLRRDRETRNALEVKGASAARLREARRQVTDDEQHVKLCWNLMHEPDGKEPDLEAIEKEATALAAELKERSAKENLDDRWARVEIRAPFDGVILERNIAEGKVINDVTFDLFKIADLSRLRVWANVFEDDLPALQELQARQAKRQQSIRWLVQPKADAKADAIAGWVDRIGDIVDPNDHTARVTGYVSNPDRTLRAGQYITATIPLLPEMDQVEVPATALVSADRDNYLFVQREPGKNDYTLRKVKVLRRYQDWVTIEEVEGLRPEDRVVSAGAVELKAQLDDLQNAKK